MHFGAGGNERQIGIASLTETFGQSLCRKTVLSADNRHPSPDRIRSNTSAKLDNESLLRGDAIDE